jgi:hypothetical protein
MCAADICRLEALHGDRGPNVYLLQELQEAEAESKAARASASLMQAQLQQRTAELAAIKRQVPITFKILTAC